MCHCLHKLSLSTGILIRTLNGQLCVRLLNAHFQQRCFFSNKLFKGPNN